MNDPMPNPGSAAPRTSIVEDLFVEALGVPVQERSRWLDCRDATAEERTAAQRIGLQK